MSIVNSALVCVASVCCCAVLSFDGRPMELAASDCPIARHALSEIRGRGECPDYVPSQYCGAEVTDCNGTCVGDTYNPFDDCENACFECQEGCDDTCNRSCSDACGEDPDCYNACYAGCTAGCRNGCPCDCDGLPTDDRKDCENENPELRLYTESSTFTAVIHDAISSNYTDIPWETHHCFDITQCGTYCLHNLESNSFQCVLGAESESPPNHVPHSVDPPTPGMCPPAGL